MLITTPFTLSLVFKFLRDSSNIASKDSSVTTDSLDLISSLIVSSTSFIILAGVEAPAVTPMLRVDFTRLVSSSCAVSIKQVFLHLLLHISYSLPVFELWRSPITIIRSETEDNASASSCRSDVALHIVSNISEFVQTFFIVFKHFFHSFLLNVV